MRGKRRQAVNDRYNRSPCAFGKEVELLPREEIEPMIGGGNGLDVIHGPERYHGAYSLAVHALLDGAHVVWARGMRR